MREISNYKNILVYRIGHLGDTIVALPAFWKIRQKFPDSEITLLTNYDSKNKNYAMARNVLPENDLFDSIICYDNSVAKLKKAVKFGALLFDLRKKNFDCLFYLTTRVRTLEQVERDLKFFRAAGIKEIFGIEHLKNKRLDYKQSRPLPAVEPEYKFLLDCLPFGDTQTIAENDRQMALTQFEKKSARVWLEKNCGSDFEKKKLIAVAPGSKWDSKKWFEERFVEVIQRLIEKFDIFPVIFGGREDFETGQKLLDNVTAGANAAGALNIREGSAVLEYCRLYLGNDTGTMHMAAAVGVPCVALFAAIDFPGRWYPFGENNRIFRYSVECEGCHTPNCYMNHKCLELIESDKVFEACSEILIG